MLESPPWFKAYNWLCRLTLGPMMRLLTLACVTPGPEAPPVGHSHSSAAMKVQHSSSSFSSTVLLSLTRHARWAPVRKEESKKKPKKKPNPVSEQGETTRRSLHSYYWWLHSLIIPETSCKHACWKRPAETEQLIWKEAEFSPGRATGQLRTFRAGDASHPPEDTSPTTQERFQPKRKGEGQSVR